MKTIIQNFIKNYQEFKTTTIGFIVLFGVGYMVYKKIIEPHYFIAALPFILVMFGIHDDAFKAKREEAENEPEPVQAEEAKTVIPDQVPEINNTTASS